MSRFDDDTSRLSSAEVPLVVEIVSPGSRTMDRVTKPALYVSAYVLDGDAYREAGSWGPGATMSVQAPFPVTISLDELNRS